jgi:hypothetical protein
VFVDSSIAMPIGSVPAVTAVAFRPHPRATCALHVAPSISDSVPVVPFPTYTVCVDRFSVIPVGKPPTVIDGCAGGLPRSWAAVAPEAVPAARTTSAVPRRMSIRTDR